MLPLPLILFLAIKSIYGTDSRQDYYEVSDPIVRRSFPTVAALIHRIDVTFSLEKIIFPNTTAASEMNLCPSERFTDQPSPTFCSGVLVKADVVLTAGHCVTDQDECADTLIGFDYIIDKAGEYPHSLPIKNVYPCKRILKQLRTKAGVDYALLQLNRPVDDRTPAQVGTGKDPRLLDRIFVIGHPIGLPAKAATGFVRANYKNYFETNLDTFSGNSGSPVFDSIDGSLLGILIEGEEDFVRQGECKVSKQCTDSTCKGEKVCRANTCF